MDWFATEAARRLVAFELRQIIPILSAHIGVRGLFLRPGEQAPAELSGNMLQSVVSVHRNGSGRFDGQVSFDPMELPFAVDTFSLVCALHVIEQTDEAESLLAEISRCLQPEGLLVALVLNGPSPWWLRWRRGGMRVPSRGRTRSMIEESGLSIEIQRPIGTLWRLPDPDGAHAAMPRMPVLQDLCCSQLWVARKRRIPLTPQRQTAAVGVPAGMGLR